MFDLQTAQEFKKIYLFNTPVVDRRCDMFVTPEEPMLTGRTKGVVTAVNWESSEEVVKCCEKVSEDIYFFYKVLL